MWTKGLIRKGQRHRLYRRCHHRASLIAKRAATMPGTLEEIPPSWTDPISGEDSRYHHRRRRHDRRGPRHLRAGPELHGGKNPHDCRGLRPSRCCPPGIPTNCTLIFSANQALLAARAGQTSAPSWAVLRRYRPAGRPGWSETSTICFSNLSRYRGLRSLPPACLGPIHVTDFCALARGRPLPRLPPKLSSRLLHHPA